MELNEKLPAEFLEALAELDRESRALAPEAAQPAPEPEAPAEEVPEPELPAEDYAAASRSVLADYRQQLSGLLNEDMDRMRDAFERLQRCKEQLALVEEAEESIRDPERCAAYAEKSRPQVSVTLDGLLRGESNLISLAYRVNRALEAKWGPNRREVCGTFVETALRARELLETEIRRLRSSIDRSARELQTRSVAAGAGVEGELAAAWSSAQNAMDNAVRRSVRAEREAAGAGTEVRADSEGAKRALEALQEGFLSRFPPAKLLEDHKSIYAREPVAGRYVRPVAQPRRLHAADLEYDLTPLNLSGETRAFLDRHYYFLWNGTRLCLPFCVTLGPDFNWLLRFGGEARQDAAEDARGLALRLFLLLPPRKAVFTFGDPATLGESFALFHRLVSAGGRNREIIDGGVWADPGDIEERLRLLTVHIAGVTQRCLQGRYRTVLDYNQAAGDNAEAYRFLLLMDFPAGMNSRTLGYLEQIAEFGPKCGVFPLIFCSEERMAQAPESFVPRIEALAERFRVFRREREGQPMEYPACSAAGCRAELRIPPIPEGEELDAVLEALRQGLEDADAVPAGAERFAVQRRQGLDTGTAEDGFRVPIGLGEGSETQYLTLLPQPGQHVLIAAGDRAESAALLHTVLMNALDRYRSPEELEICLAEFRQGTEFLPYAAYSLPCFRVLSSHSEAVLGRSILRGVEHELKIREDLFHRAGVEDFAAYRSLPRSRAELPLSRLLVVLDEFQELLAPGADPGGESLRALERIVRSGAQCGVHLILSSRSFSACAGSAGQLYAGMRVRIVLKCADAEGELLLENGRKETELIPEGAPGRGLINCEAGAAGASVHFQALAYDAAARQEKLEALNRPGEDQTRILMADPSDNPRSIFNRFPDFPRSRRPEPGLLCLGESLVPGDSLPARLSRESASNLLLLGPDSEKARSIFAYAMLSLLTADRAARGRRRGAPWLYLLNYKPLRDRYFVDGPELLARRLPGDVANVPVSDPAAAAEQIRDLYRRAVSERGEPRGEDVFLLLFGYQRALDLRDETQDAGGPSLREMLGELLLRGPEKGIHTLLWHDSFQGFSLTDAALLPRFRQRIAFNLSGEDFSRFIGFHDPGSLGEGCAVFDNRLEDLRPFLPYRAPDRVWLEALCEKLERFA